MQLPIAVEKNNHKSVKCSQMQNFCAVVDAFIFFQHGIFLMMGPIAKDPDKRVPSIRGNKQTHAHEDDVVTTQWYTE